MKSQRIKKIAFWSLCGVSIFIWGYIRGSESIMDTVEHDRRLSRSLDSVSSMYTLELLHENKETEVIRYHIHRLEEIEKDIGNLNTSDTAFARFIGTIKERRTYYQGEIDTKSISKHISSSHNEESF